MGTEEIPPRYTMKFARWTGIEVHVVTEDSTTHPPDDVGDIYLYFRTWGALKCLVLEAMGALLDIGHHAALGRSAHRERFRQAAGRYVVVNLMDGSTDV